MLFIIITLLVFITQSVFTHWWLIAIDAFFAALLVGKTPFRSFLSGFVAVALVWLAMALFINQQNEGLLLGKVSELFSLSSTWLLVITTLIGAFVGGFSALSGFYLKAIFMKKK